MPAIDRKRQGSNVWSGINKAWEHVESGIEVDSSQGVVRWKYSNSDLFTIKSAYDSIMKEEVSNEKVWGKLWKLPIIQHCKSFLWLAFHNKLLSNEVRLNRNLCADATCKACGDSLESLLHILRDCGATRDLWMSIIKPYFCQRFF